MNIFAVDVGFGTTAVVNKIGMSSEVQYFNSRAVQLKAEGRNLGEGVLKERNIIKVEVDGIFYEVGPDVIDNAGATEVRSLNESYISSAKYRALFLGSLNFCEHDDIDLIVGGLPISNLKRKEELVNLMVGTHKVGDRVITVKAARVIPQPLGALMHYAKTQSLQERSDLMSVLARKTRLVVDPGYGTFDWLTVCGVKPDESRSDAEPLGFGRILADCSDHLSSIFDQKISVEIIDQAFREGALTLFGRSYDFPSNNDDDVVFDLRPIVQKITNDAVDAMVNNVGGGADIDQILVTGGPAEIYLQAIQKAYSKHNVQIINQHDIAVGLGMGEIARQIAGAM